MNFILKLWAIVVSLNLATSQMREHPCTNLPNQTGFVQDFSSCPAYYSCVNGVAFNILCPSPFHFIETTFGDGKCTWPEIANCQRCPETGAHNIRVPDSCTRFTQCINGTPLDRECALGLHFNPMLGMCDLPENVLCDIKPCALLPAKFNGTGDAPSPIICNDFYICHNGQLLQPDPIRCLPGTLFDSETFQCALATNAVCFPGSLPI